MKKIIFGVAIATALVSPGIAVADSTGYVGIGAATLDDNNDSSKEDIVSVEGAIATTLGGDWSLAFTASNYDMGHNDHSHTYPSIDAQLIKNTDAYSIGGYFGSTVDSLYGVGVGGSYYLGQFTIGGDVSYAVDRYDGDYPVTTATVRAGYYIHDNFVVTGEYGYTDSEWEGEEADIWGVGAEYQFANSPFSLSANYMMAEGDFSEAESFGLGLRYHFGTTDLISRDRTGAMSGFRTVARNQALIY